MHIAYLEDPTDPGLAQPMIDQPDAGRVVALQVHTCFIPLVAATGPKAVEYTFLCTSNQCGKLSQAAVEKGGGPHCGEGQRGTETRIQNRNVYATLPWH